MGCLRDIFPRERLNLVKLGMATIVSFIIALGWAFSLLGTQAAGDAPPLPHSVSGEGICLSCHGSQGIHPVPASHLDYKESSCSICHQVAPATATPPASEPSPGPAAPESSCLACHRQPGLSLTLSNRETLSLFIAPDAYAASVHGDKLLCADCHTAITGYPHPPWEIPGRREYSIAQYELCKRCHFDNYTKSLDSIHYQMFSQGDLRAPLCTDCHGAHDVTLPSQPRARISQTCSQCHEAISRQYQSSVHGKALIEENNYDVPVCNDCHQSHTIEDPRTASFRLQSVHLCAGCHGNDALMVKYGISSKVVQTYLQDFHGRTVALGEKKSKDIWVEEAVCTDCHGIHDIQAVDNPGSPVIKANLAATCNKCHPNITTNFPSAWLSHYEPSLHKSPLIFFVRWFYRILIPFIIVGISIHVILDLWRRITNR